MGGPNPISMAAIMAYLSATGVVDIDERVRLIRLIDRLDNEWLQQVRQSNEKKRTSNGNQRPKRPHRR